MTDFKFSPAATPQTQVEVDTLTAQGRIVRKPSRAVEPVTKASDRSDWTPQMFEYQAEMDRMVSQPRSEISCVLSLLEPAAWMAGLWGDEKAGWHDARTNTFLSFDDARDLISARIKELGLDETLVNAHPKSKSSAAEYQQF